MKIRTGFVSNSSSSSFMLVAPGGTTEEGIRSWIEKQVGTMGGFFIPEFRQQLIDTIMECKGDIVDLKKNLEFENKWIAENPDADTDERDFIQGRIDSGKDYYEGRFSDNGDDPLQFMLCYTGFKVEDGDFSMESDVGY